MTLINDDNPAAPRTDETDEGRAGAAESCDRCGRSVSRETAAREWHGAGDDAEAVPVCTDCEYGTD